LIRIGFMQRDLLFSVVFTDQGEHWTRFPGFNFKWAHRMIPDPEDPNAVYVTTLGAACGTAWRLAAWSG
jgi:hypothetical protein